MPLRKLTTPRPREDRVQAAAQAAWDAGKPTFVASLPISSTGMLKGMGHEEVARELDAIILMGWKLDTWTVVTSGSTGMTTAVPLFVRPGAQLRA